MKKAEKEAADELRSEYKKSDFDEIVRGKYASKIKENSNVVLLEADVARAFPNDEAVNKALRSLIELAQSSVRLKKYSGGAG
jgi:hypothetical protein